MPMPIFLYLSVTLLSLPFHAAIALPLVTQFSFNCQLSHSFQFRQQRCSPKCHLPHLYVYHTSLIDLNLSRPNISSTAQQNQARRDRWDRRQQQWQRSMASAPEDPVAPPAPPAIRTSLQSSLRLTPTVKNSTRFSKRCYIDFVLAFPQAPVLTDIYMKPPHVPRDFIIPDLPSYTDRFTKVYK